MTVYHMEKYAKGKYVYSGLFLILLSWLTLIGGCGGSSGDDACSVVEENQFIHEVMLDAYLWYQDIPATVNYDDYDSPQDLLWDIRSHRDRFSYITDAESHTRIYNEGRDYGYGFSFHVTADTEVILRYVYADSPAGRAGLRRGDKLLRIDGLTPVQISNSLSWGSVFDADQASLVVQGEGGSTSMTLRKNIYSINTVLFDEIIVQNDDVIGYLVFKGFLSTSSEELNEVFTRFNNAGVNKVVLDLRYNGGGLVSIANELASWLRQTAENTEDVFVDLIYNDKHQDRNKQYQLVHKPNGLNLDQLVIIATEWTCSASELVVSGLRPYLDVQIVGNTTCGKPVGMNRFEHCDLAFLPVTFQTVNSLGEGEYFNGLTPYPNCQVDDDPSIGFGEDSEPMLGQALGFIANGSCQNLVRKSLPPLFVDPEPGFMEAPIGDG